MQIKLDLKTLVIGFFAGILISLAFGFNGAADQADFGISMPNNGFALVQTNEGNFYVVNSQTGMAVRVLIYENPDKTPNDSRLIRNVRPLNFNQARD